MLDRQLRLDRLGNGKFPQPNGSCSSLSDGEIAIELLDESGATSKQFGRQAIENIWQPGGDHHRLACRPRPAV